eukprot:2582798-Amphidinium_carterae.1
MAQKNTDVTPHVSFIQQLLTIVVVSTLAASTRAFTNFNLQAICQSSLYDRLAAKSWVTLAAPIAVEPTNVTIAVEPTSVTIEEDEVLCNGFWAMAHNLDLAARLGRSYPLFWLHVPRTGTTFGVSIFEHTGFCPRWQKPALARGKHQHLTQAYIKKNHPCSPATVEKALAQHYSYLSIAHSLSLRHEEIGASVTILRKPETHVMSMAHTMAKCNSSECHRKYARALSLVPLGQLVSPPELRAF